MLVFSAFVPHSPLLLESIGQENRDKLTQTLKAYQELEKILYAAQPESLVIVSKHDDALLSEAFTVSFSDSYRIDFSKLGDFQTHLERKADLELIQKIKEKVITKHPVSLISQPILDQGAGIPLYLLVDKLKDLKLVPIHFSMLSNREHYDFGRELKEVIINTPKRVAVVAVGDLSHCLTQNAPCSYNPQGEKFDNLVIESLKKNTPNQLIKIDDKLSQQVNECGLRSLLILLGVLDEVDYQAEVLSYEHPFGVGYLTVYFHLS